MQLDLLSAKGFAVAGLQVESSHQSTMHQMHQVDILFICFAFGAPKSRHEHCDNGGTCGEWRPGIPSSASCSATFFKINPPILGFAPIQLQNIPAGAEASRQSPCHSNI